ncbi:MAG: hypothetical protein D3909_12670 [Candidatus Electrothrix sp. ATG1]|nr:hypothetical protein [Candidatus Electrothrix sp. ATG1]
MEYILHSLYTCVQDMRIQQNDMTCRPDFFFFAMVLLPYHRAALSAAAMFPFPVKDLPAWTIQQHS